MLSDSQLDNCFRKWASRGRPTKVQSWFERSKYEGSESRKDPRRGLWLCLMSRAFTFVGLLKSVDGIYNLLQNDRKRFPVNVLILLWPLTSDANRELYSVTYLLQPMLCYLRAWCVTATDFLAGRAIPSDPSCLTTLGMGVWSGRLASQKSKKLTDKPCTSTYNDTI